MSWYTPLMFCSYESKDWISILTLLLKEGANLNELDENGASLIFTFIEKFPYNERNFSESLNKIKFLLENGANLQITSSLKKETPLHAVIENIDISFMQGATEKLIDLLLEYGADINAPNIYGTTPLHSAIINERLDAALILITRGSDLSLVDNNGLSPSALLEQLYGKTSDSDSKKFYQAIKSAILKMKP